MQLQMQQMQQQMQQPTLQWPQPGAGDFSGPPPQQPRPSGGYARHESADDINLPRVLNNFCKQQVRAAALP
jgi:hypothetical protein